jgi:raffinose/stachyose/melibiose transport system permease protein
MGPRRFIGAGAVHGVLLTYTLIALFPIFMIVSNSFKSRKGIFRDPLALPDADTLSFIGFTKVLDKSNFLLYFSNSMTVTVVTLVVVLFIGAMAAWALAEYRFPGNTLLGIYLALGIMVPIRLGSVSILQLIVDLNLINTLTALILVYTAQSLPLAVFILTEFMRQIPNDLKEAARCDGINR